VTDPQSAVITSAVVTLSNAGTGFSRAVTTDQRGEYQFVQVAPGTYTIVVEMVGFAKLTRTDVQLLVNTPTTLDKNAGLVPQNTTTGNTYQGVNGNAANVNSGSTPCCRFRSIRCRNSASPLAAKGPIKDDPRAARLC
jgi:hypothetical protein